MHRYVYVCICIHVYVYILIYAMHIICTSHPSFTNTYTYIHTYIHTYIYTHTHTNTHNTQAVANMLNSFAKADMWDSALMLHLSRAALLIAPSDFSTQAMVLIVTAISRAAGWKNEKEPITTGQILQDVTRARSDVDVGMDDRIPYSERDDEHVWETLHSAKVVEYIAQVCMCVCVCMYV